MNEAYTPEVSEILDVIGIAFAKARQKHAPMHSPHEGYAIIKEEFDELWEEIRRWQPKPPDFDQAGEEFSITSPIPAEHRAYAANMVAMRKEALHVAAMALAFLVEVVP